MDTIGEKVFLGVVALIGGMLGGVSLGAIHVRAASPSATTISSSEGRARAVNLAHSSMPVLLRAPRAPIAETASQSYAIASGAPAAPQSAMGSLPSATLASPADQPQPRLAPQAVRELAERCAPAVPASVLASIAKVESGDNALTIGQNEMKHLAFRPASRQAAEALASRLIASGANIDLGLTQINSRNLGWLGLSIEDAFDPCRNLAGAAKIIDRGYNAALRAGPQNRPLLQTAFSLYNTGNAERGLENGYVDKVEAARRE